MASEFGIDSSAHLLQCARKPDLVLAHSQQVCKYAITQGIRAERIHHAYNYHFYHRREISYEHEISFVGNLSERREAVLFDLALCGYEVYVATIFDAERVNQVYNASKITLHIHAAEETYIPTRFFEVLPTKACLLTEDFGANTDVSLGSNYFATFDNLENLCEQLDFLLANENLRLEKVKQANMIAPRNTWAERMKEYSNYFEMLLGNTMV